MTKPNMGGDKWMSTARNRRTSGSKPGRETITFRGTIRVDVAAMQRALQWYNDRHIRKALQWLLQGHNPLSGREVPEDFEFGALAVYKRLRQAIEFEGEDERPDGAPIRRPYRPR